MSFHVTSPHKLTPLDGLPISIDPPRAQLFAPSLSLQGNTKAEKAVTSRAGWEFKSGQGPIPRHY